MPECIGTKLASVRLREDERGFSIAELLVVMGIFLTVMLITSSAFKTIVNQTAQQGKSLETQIEGVVGLEVLRADLEQAGFGLPWTFSMPITYSEASLSSSMPSAGYWVSGSAEDFNDAPSAAPRAIQSGNTKFNYDSGNLGAKYLVIKSTVAATNDTAKKWTNLSVLSGIPNTPRVWNSASRDLLATERVIVVKNDLLPTPPTRQLMATGSAKFSATFSNRSSLIKNPVDGDTYQIYGIAPPTSSSSELVRMPFNRADYYVATPLKMPAACAPHTGVLYKANISHSSGGYDPQIPLVDCVADLQVVYGLDGDASGRVNQYLEAPANTATPTATDIRDQLREIRVYILAQDGPKDSMYTYPSQTVAVGEALNGVFRGRVFDLAQLIGSGWQNYRWKVYSIVVRPKNLIQ